MTSHVDHELDIDDPIEAEPDVRNDAYVPLPDDPEPAEDEA